LRTDERFDVVVAGAGPAGLMAALGLAREGHRVLVADRKDRLGSPVRCAEGIGQEALRDYVALDERWISAAIRSVRLVAPSGGSVQLDSLAPGLILDRVGFEEDLGRQALKAGARIDLNTCVTDLLIEQGDVRGACLQGGGGVHRIACSLVVAADGVESRVARMAGLETALALKDVETCAQYLLEDIEIDEHRCDFFFGRSIAPGGYAWVFPKGRRRANVGLGVSGGQAARCSPRELLERFVEEHYPRGRKTRFTAGGVPVSRPLARLYTAGLVVVGDAARQSNPLSGGGIIPALEAGRLAAETAHRALVRGDLSRRALAAYAAAWNRSLGRSQKRYYRLKEAVSRLPDDTLERTAHALSAVDPKNLTLFRVFATALRRHPRLIWDARHLFLPSA
jgi:digeranylgeranylglycerophospholipid reductase